MISAEEADTKLRKVARIFLAMKECDACVFQALKGDPFCSRHALALGHEIGSYVVEEGILVMPTWKELFPEGRVIIYEGDDPDKFAAEIEREFGFDPSQDDTWRDEAPWFFCPAEHLDEIYGGDRWQVGS